MRHSVSVANEVGWAEIENGDLLRAAEKDAFEVFITADQSIFYQQNNARRQIALVVLNTNHWGRISRQTHLVLNAVNAAVPASFIFIEFDYLRKKFYPRAESD